MIKLTLNETILNELKKELDEKYYKNLLKNNTIYIYFANPHITKTSCYYSHNEIKIILRKIFKYYPKLINSRDECGRLLIDSYFNYESEDFFNENFLKYENYINFKFLKKNPFYVYFGENEIFLNDNYLKIKKLLLTNKIKKQFLKSKNKNTNLISTLKEIYI